MRVWVFLLLLFSKTLFSTLSNLKIFFLPIFFHIPILSLIQILLCTKMSHTYLVLRVLLSLFSVEKSSLYANCACTLSVHTHNVALLLRWHGTVWPGWTNERGVDPTSASAGSANQSVALCYSQPALASALFSSLPVQEEVYPSCLGRVLD